MIDGKIQVVVVADEEGPYVEIVLDGESIFGIPPENILRFCEQLLQGKEVCDKYMLEQDTGTLK